MIYDKITALVRRDPRELALTLSVMEDIARKKLSASQAQRSHQNPTMLALLFLMSSLCNCKKINVCCLSYMVRGILSWQQEWMKTYTLIKKTSAVHN